MTEPTGPLSSGENDASLVRREEELITGTAVQEAGRVGVRKLVEHEPVETVVPRDVEHAEFERQRPGEVDSGEVEVLADGSVSIPVFEEELVIQKRLVVRERVIVRKHTVTEERRVEADLRRERVEVEADREVADRVRTSDGELDQAG
jgi:uncharacterized protein (TIGR02271 family)